MQKNGKKQNKGASLKFPILTAVKAAVFGFLFLLIMYSVFAAAALKSDTWVLQNKMSVISYIILAIAVFCASSAATAASRQYKLPCTLLTAFLIMLLTFFTVVVIAGGPLQSTTCLIIIPVCLVAGLAGWFAAKNIKRRH